MQPKPLTEAEKEAMLEYLADIEIVIRGLRASLEAAQTDPVQASVLRGFWTCLRPVTDPLRSMCQIVRTIAHQVEEKRLRNS